MEKNTIKWAMYLNYFVFAILLNSVGIVILKAQRNYGVDELEASILEAFKELSLFWLLHFYQELVIKERCSLGLVWCIWLV